MGFQYSLEVNVNALIIFIKLDFNEYQIRDPFSILSWFALVSRSHLNKKKTMRKYRVSGAQGTNIKDE